MMKSIYRSCTPTPTNSQASVDLRDHDDGCFGLFTPLNVKIAFNAESLNKEINFNSEIDHFDNSKSKSSLLMQN